MTPRTSRVAAAVAAQVVLVGVAVWVPLAARVTGEEVLLRVQVADTYEPFADAYVDVAYPDLPLQPVRDEPESFDDDPARGTAYVPLTREGSTWVGGEVQRTPPESGPFLLCDDDSWRLRCGIETAYVASGEPEQLRRALLEGDAVAVVKVDGGGHAALVGVRVG